MLAKEGTVLGVVGRACNGSQLEAVPGLTMVRTAAIVFVLYMLVAFLAVPAYAPG